MPFEAFDYSIPIENSQLPPVAAELETLVGETGPTLDAALREVAREEGVGGGERGDVLDREAMRDAAAPDLWVSGRAGTAHREMQTFGHRLEADSGSIVGENGVADMQELSSKDVTHMAAGWEEWENIPEDGMPYTSKMTDPAAAIHVDPNASEETVAILRALALGLGVELIYDVLTAPPQETWVDMAPAPGMSLNETRLSSFAADVFQGNSSLTNYTDIPMQSIGDGQGMGVYFNPDGSSTMFIAHDTDGDGATNAVYMRDESGTWWVATSTDEQGNPIWTPSAPPERFPEPNEQSEG